LKLTYLESETLADVDCLRLP